MDFRRLSTRLTVALIATIALCLTNCRSSRTTSAVERREGHTETVVRETRTTDSVFIHDSVYIREGGDTVYMTRWRTCWRDRIIHDTVYDHRTDTIYQSRTEEKTVEVKAKGGNTGWAVAAALFLLILVYILIKTLLKHH